MTPGPARLRQAGTEVTSRPRRRRKVLENLRTDVAYHGDAWGWKMPPTSRSISRQQRRSRGRWVGGEPLLQPCCWRSRREAAPLGLLLPRTPVRDQSPLADIGCRRLVLLIIMCRLRGGRDADVGCCGGGARFPEWSQADSRTHATACLPPPACTMWEPCARTLRVLEVGYLRSPASGVPFHWPCPLNVPLILRGQPSVMPSGSHHTVIIHTHKVRMFVHVEGCGRLTTSSAS